MCVGGEGEGGSEFFLSSSSEKKKHGKKNFKKKKKTPTATHPGLRAVLVAAPAAGGLARADHHEPLGGAEAVRLGLLAGGLGVGVELFSENS